MKVKLTGKKVIADDASIRWVVLSPSPLSDSEIISELGFTAYYGGPGRFFSECGRVLRTRTRILVTQWCGWDV